ncbi:hypothetical protein QBC46DRAFT_354440 [Diplogelasinospora grovesii]|uniref:F-box domain-containing protein n=1 Tax=Diplogelasinospora grovesii TaxID=303347 RepID=A0AAN6S4G6_9PEZI|nr:hypothetical protein QBC46DRAFT_354440 [Diplogelasinospora grovesii]
MDQTDTLCASAASAAERVPVEVWKLVLSLLPNLTSLQSAALTSRAVYSAFLDQRERMVGRVLLNHLGDPDVYKHAVLRYECDLSSTQRAAFAVGFFRKYQDFVPSTSWTLREARVIARHHSMIEHRTDRLCDHWVISESSVSWAGKYTLGLEMGGFEPPKRR